jgi:hypothetical protein
MNTSTAKIANFIHKSDVRSTAKHSNLIPDPEMRSAALVWTISLLGAALFAFIVFALGIVPADLDLSSPP